MGDTALDWLVDAFLPRVLGWGSLAADHVAELKAAVQLLHTQAVFAGELAPAQVQGWNQGVQQLARASSAHVRWVAGCLLGATARTSSPSVFVAYGTGWMSVLLPLSFLPGCYRSRC